jgi:hypothetical protein
MIVGIVVGMVTRNAKVVFVWVGWAGVGRAPGAFG